MIQLPRFDVSRRGQTGQFTEEVERRFADAIKHLEVPACRVWEMAVWAIDGVRFHVCFP